MKRKWFVFLLIVVLLMGTFQTVFADDGTDPATPTKTEENFESNDPVQTQVIPKLTPALANGNFESGATGWGQFDTGGFPLIGTVNFLTPHSGSYLTWLGGADSNISEIYQTSLTISNPTYLNLWYWVGSQETTCSVANSFLEDHAYVSVFYGSFEYIEAYWSLCSANNTNGWVELNLNLSSHSGQTVQLIISATTDASENSNLFIDDVSLYRRFADVPNGGFADDYIESIYNAGITGGCQVSPVLKYCPNNTVSRAQMAIFLLRGMNGSSYTPPPATGTVFTDVPMGSFGADFIEAFSAAGITGGCGGGNYCPSSSVTRAQMAIFLLRAKHGASYDPPAATGTMFSDVPLSHPQVEWIEQLANEGITGGCGGGNYCPNTPVNRAQMAIFIQRTFSLTMP